MKISEYFKLDKEQAELDFVDVPADGDIQLYVDPFSLSHKMDEFSNACSADITVYFQSLIDAIRFSDDRRANYLVGHLHEPNDTHLGLSSGRPSGRGIGGIQATHLLKALRGSEAVKTGFVTDLSDTELLIDGIGPDKVSDITTNIIRRRLIEYTQAQCALLDIPLRNGVASGFMWDTEKQEWNSDYANLPVIDNERLLLVPKYLVSWQVALHHQEYYESYVLDYLRAREIEAGSGLVRIIKSTGQRKVTKKELREKYPYSKGFLYDFSKNHPEVLKEYKESKGTIRAIRDSELEEDFDEIEFAGILRNRLQAIPQGNECATRYHHFMVGVLSFIFYPNLYYPVVEEEINEGRKRIDMRYTNTAISGLFQRFTPTTRKASIRIPVECKNYTKDIANPELDQIAGRFGDNSGWLGFIVCRHLDDKELFIARCRDTARAGRGWIICFDDIDIIELLERIIRRERNTIDNWIANRFGRLTE